MQALVGSPLPRLLLCHYFVSAPIRHRLHNGKITSLWGPWAGRPEKITRIISLGPIRAEALCPVSQGWLTSEGRLFAALQFRNSVILSSRIIGQATGLERWDKMSPDIWERPWGQPEIGLQFSFYLFQGDIKRNILYFLTWNSQWRQKESQVNIA